VFARDDGLVQQIVADLRGDVLDVGCGEGRYHDVIAPRALGGVLRWTGLEPEAARADAMRKRSPWAEVRIGEAEAIEDVARFDHVIVLRSWNHLRDPDRAVRAMVRALRPGGTLLVVDGVAFGLLRRQSERWKRGPSAWEHYRNDDAARAHGLLSAHPLVLMKRRDVAAGTSSEWLLHYRRP
jgi:SAM-dependent methyltransferase